MRIWILPSATLLISRAIHARYFISGGTQVNYHFATVVVNMVKQEATRYRASYHGAKHYLFANFHCPVLL